MREKKYQAEQHRLTVARLRHKLQKFELVPTAGEAVPSGFEAIDACLSPHHGLLRGGLHEICAAKTGDFASAAGFGAHLAAQFADGNAVVSGQTDNLSVSMADPMRWPCRWLGLSGSSSFILTGRICRICCGPRKRRWVVRRLGAWC